jgi:tRNA 2-thiouridine synthesizing protein A
MDKPRSRPPEIEEYRITGPWLDLRGLACPLPVLKARKALAGMAPGERLGVESDDPVAAIDLPHFCAEAGHVLVAALRQADGGIRFVIERGGEAA